MSKEFLISTYKSPVSNLRFRDGIFYGCIEDYECTMPCHTEAQARQEAQKQLQNGGFRARLVALRQHYQRWLDQYAGGPATDTTVQFDPMAVQARIRAIDVLVRRLDAAGQ